MTAIVRQEEWEPLRDSARLTQEEDRRRPRTARSAVRRGVRVFPSVIISTARGQLVVRAEVPGMKLEDFEISMSADTLTVQGTRRTDESLAGGSYHRRERDSGSFCRAIRLPAAVDSERAEATYVAGVLVISLPLQAADRRAEVRFRVQEG